MGQNTVWKIFQVPRLDSENERQMYEPLPQRAKDNHLSHKCKEKDEHKYKTESITCNS